MTGSDRKLALRAQARETRSRLNPSLELAEAAAERFFDHVAPQAGQVVAAYAPKGTEFDVRPIIDDCLRRGITLALPRVPEQGRVMEFVAWREGDALAENAYKIAEPAAGEPVMPDIVIVPLLAFDRKGHRLGYGGGYYDATLEHLRRLHRIVAVGIGYGEQAVLFNLPTDEHDQPLDLIITPQGVFDYR